MISGQINSESIKTTSYKVVLPFYLYAAISFLISAVLLLTSTSAFLQHYFHPQILAITHLMALGWATMIILGASHQLVPVLIEGKLYSNTLGYISFILAAIGIPLLVYGFYVFNMGEPAKWGGRFVLLAILTYLINLGVSISKGKNESIHAIYVFTSVVWLFLTAFLGLFLVYNFTTDLLPDNSLHYLPLHVHAGIVGWFLLMVIGVSSRLIPMFLISKYQNTKLLRWIFILINTALASYILIFYFTKNTEYIFLSWIELFMGIVLFIYYCYCSFKQRIRRQVDEQMKISLLSVLMMLVPVILLLIVIITISIFSKENASLSLSYGVLILFGWVTAIILGMTFKTLPFIVWNKVYHHRSGLSKTPNPKDLFSNSVFKVMSAAYLLGLVLFVTGSLLSYLILLKAGGIFILAAAILYVFNVIKVITHKPNIK
ncbi:MAG TPA: cytochrome C oxidase subunit I [Bacteroidia bacterium]|nr:cytochrome C oxidase subunit I [Bacteroidia bacterium]